MILSTVKVISFDFLSAEPLTNSKGLQKNRIKLSLDKDKYNIAAEKIYSQKSLLKKIKQFINKLFFCIEIQFANETFLVNKSSLLKRLDLKKCKKDWIVDKLIELFGKTENFETKNSQPNNDSISIEEEGFLSSSDSFEEEEKSIGNISVEEFDLVSESDSGDSDSNSSDDSDLPQLNNSAIVSPTPIKIVLPDPEWDIEILDDERLIPICNESKKEELLLEPQLLENPLNHFKRLLADYLAPRELQNLLFVSKLQAQLNPYLLQKNQRLTAAQVLEKLKKGRDSINRTLDKLNLENTVLEKDTLKEIISYCPNLKSLNLSLSNFSVLNQLIQEGIDLNADNQSHLNAENLRKIYRNSLLELLKNKQQLYKLTKDEKLKKELFGDFSIFQDLEVADFFTVNFVSNLGMPTFLEGLMNFLSNCKSLKKLDLTILKKRDDIASIIKVIPETVIDLSIGDVDDTIINQLSLKLKSLELECKSDTDSLFQRFTVLETLKVSLYPSILSQQVLQNLPNTLKKLSVYSANGLKKETIENLPDGLQELRLLRCSSQSDYSIFQDPSSLPRSLTRLFYQVSGSNLLDFINVNWPPNLREVKIKIYPGQEGFLRKLPPVTQKLTIACSHDLDVQTFSNLPENLEYLDLDQLHSLKVINLDKKISLPKKLTIIKLPNLSSVNSNHYYDFLKFKLNDLFENVEKVTFQIDSFEKGLIHPIIIQRIVIWCKINRVEIIDYNKQFKFFF